MRLNLLGDKVSAKGHVLGCAACPLDKEPGARKLIGIDRVRGRDVFLWGQQASTGDAAAGRELTGDQGDLVWRALAAHGFERGDCDTQNVVRCGIPGREPTKREVQCCSAHTDEALRRGARRAKVHVVLGDLAGEQLLGARFRKDTPVVWSDDLGAYAVLAQHPWSILKQGEEGWAYDRWVERFRAARAVVEHPGRWGYLKAQDYRTVVDKAGFDEMERALRAEAKVRRVSLDVEDDRVDGVRVPLLAGFGTGRFQDPRDMSSWRGTSWSVVLQHPQSGHGAAKLRYLKDRVRALVEDPSIRKTLQNGAYDRQSLRETLGATLRGYDYDTQYGTFLAYSFLRSCKLGDLTYLFFPEFADYKDVVQPWEKTGFSKAPLDRLLLRNMGDCDVTKRLEERFSPQVPAPLVRVYIHAGLTLDRMEGRGPILDWESWRRAEDALPLMMEKLDRALERASGIPGFSVDKPEHVAAFVYDTLGLPEVEDCGRSTAKPVLEALEAEFGNPALGLVSKRREIGKMKSTYTSRYANSARHHDGELRTRWALTGAVTGRLRSTGSDNDGVNMQNLSGNPLLKNMLVSDANWRRALRD